MEFSAPIKVTQQRPLGVDATISPTAETITVAVHVSTPVFWLCWWSVLLLHCATAFFVVCAGALHLLLSLAKVHDATAALMISITLKRIAGLSYLGVAGLHVVAIAQMLGRSFRSRMLLLHNPPSPATLHMPGPSTPRPGRHYHNCLNCLLTGLRCAWGQVFSSTGFLGIHSRFFHVTFLVRELVEILLQSYQLWSLSYLVSRAWINTFAVTVIVANCWSIPMVNLVFRTQDATRRIMHVAVDMHLDVVCTVVVPLLIMVPRLVEFNWTTLEFSSHLLLNDVWLANAVADGRQVLVTTRLDYVSSLLPQYGIFSCLRLIKRLVRRQPLQHPGAIVPRTVNPLTAEQPTQHAIHKPNATPATSTREQRGVRFISAFLALWGFAILALHLYTTASAHDVDFPGCQLHVRPWFASNVSCAVMYVHCVRRNITGTASELAAILAQLERPVLTRFVVAHCASLSMPPTLSEFPSLGGVLVYNSTVISWPSSAAITRATHPVFVSTHLDQCDLRQSGIPQGLLHRELPQSMRILVISHSSLPELPHDIGNLWAESGLTMLRFHAAQLKAIPISLGLLPLQQLSLSGNLIHEIPDNLFANARFESLHLSGNPLSQLPIVIGDTTRLRQLFVEHTNVTALPSWVLDWAGTMSSPTGRRVVSFFGSPVCDPAHRTTYSGTYPEPICERDWLSQNGPSSYQLIRDQYPL